MSAESLAPVKGERPICGASGKTTYQSEMMAAAAGQYWGQRPYRCPNCPGWHLTTQGRRAKTPSQTARKFKKRFKGGFHPHG